MLECTNILEIRGVVVNASNGPACQTATDRGIAVIPLRRGGLYIGLAEEQKRGSTHGHDG